MVLIRISINGIVMVVVIIFFVFILLFLFGFIFVNFRIKNIIKLSINLFYFSELNNLEKFIFIVWI